MHHDQLKWSFRKLPGWVLVSFLALAVFGLGASQASASTGWEKLQGQSLCGGLQPNGKLQPPCGDKPAKYERKAVGKCPGGSFFDIGTWSCYKCPAGYNRTANNVTKWDACSKKVPDQLARATYKTKQQCPKGSFMDGRNGGECWQCPSGYGRTAVAVNEWNACGMAFKEARGAIFKGKACAEGLFYDPRKGGECWTCPQGFLRTAAAVDQWNACVRTEDLKPAEKTAALTCEAGQHFDFIDGGTCWSCPELYTRSASSVKSNHACFSKEMIWQPPSRNVPGLFGLKGAEEIAAQLIAERTQIDAAIANAAKKYKKNPQAWHDEEWERIEKTPWYSSMLSTAVLKTMIEAVQKPVAQRTQAEKDLIGSFSKAMQHNKLFLASQAQQAFDAAMAAARSKLAIKNKGQLSSLYSTVAAPPDYQGIIQGTLGTAAGAAMLGVGVVGYAANMPMFMAIAPYAASTMTVQLAEGASATTLLTSAGNSLSAAASASAGPLIIITSAVIVGAMELDKFLKIEAAEGKLRQAMDAARRPVNLAVELQKKDGMGEIGFHWASLISADTKPGPRFDMRITQLQNGANYTGPVQITTANVIDLSGNVVGGAPSSGAPAIQVQEIQVTEVDLTRANASAGSPGVNWTKIDGQASDVAIGADGTAYVVTLAGQSGGFKVAKRAKKANTWTRIPGVTAVRIAAAGTDLWTVDANGKVFVYDGKTTKPVNAPKAVDIGASVKGVWIAGADRKVYRYDGKGWAAVNGTDARRIEVDWDGRPWVINSSGEILTHIKNTQWKKVLGQKAVDLAIDKPVGVRIVGADGKMYIRKGTSNAWTPISVKAGAGSIGVGGGQIWSVNAANEIFRMQ